METIRPSRRAVSVAPERDVSASCPADKPVFEREEKSAFGDVFRRRGKRLRDRSAERGSPPQSARSRESFPPHNEIHRIEQVVYSDEPEGDEVL
jgi:hypothetical protein